MRQYLLCFWPKQGKSIQEAVMPYDEFEQPQPLQTIPEYNEQFYHDMTVGEFADDPPPLLNGIAQKRWGMLREHVKVFKPATNPGGLKRMDADYKMEAMDERHRMADMLQTMKNQFDQTFPAFAGRTSYFFKWLDGLSAALPNLVKQTLKNTYGNRFPDSAYERFVTAGVD